MLIDIIRPHNEPKPYLLIGPLSYLQCLYFRKKLLYCKEITSLVVESMALRASYYLTILYRQRFCLCRPGYCVGRNVTLLVYCI